MRRRKDKVFIMLIASIVLSVVCAIVTYISTREKYEAQELVIDTYQAINGSERLLSLMKDLESAQRGYIITGDSIFLEPFEEAREMIPIEAARLREAVSANEQQTRLLDIRILPAIEQRNHAFADLVKIHNDHGQDSASQRIAAKTGQTYMDTIRLLVNTFIQNERVSLLDHEASLIRNSQIEDIVQFASFGLIALTCTLAFLRLSRELRTVSDLVDKLERTNETLEEKVLMRTQELSDANASKDHFLGIASHDLKAPIAGMQGIIQLMRLEKKDRDDNEIAYLNFIDDACKSMLALIANLLDINRIDRREVRLKKEDVPVRDVLSRIERTFAAQAKKKDISLEISGPDAVIQTDSANLSRILENLVSNALKFSSRGQPIALRAALMGDHITFDIVDHGPGIPAAELPLLFKKFARLTNRPTAGEGSSGLGLAIVKELTELAGGSISVESKVGEGSTFSVRLPVGAR